MTFYEIYNKAFAESFPVKKLSRNRAKDKHWMTTGLRKIIVNKNRLYKKSLLKPTSENIKEYKQYRNITTTCLRKAEENYFLSIIDKEKQNLSTLWNLVGDIINPNKIKRQTRIDKLIIDDKIIRDNNGIAETLNNFFSTIGNQLALKHTSKHNFTNYLKNRIPSSMYLKPTDDQEILSLINKLQHKKSGGDDEIRPSMLKTHSDSLTPAITHIINLSFSEGRVPDKLKIAKVIPIFKKNEKHNPNNYRPISLLSIINKIMEKVMYKRVIDFLKKHKIIYDYQFGFRQGHSTNQALIEMIENIIEETEQGNNVAGLYLDLTKAFDTVDHMILLHKLDHYGIRGLPHKWFSDYLTNRTQYTIANGEKSKLAKTNCGVPQGSVLGPLLFLLYNNDIPSALQEGFKLRLFADDSNVFIADHDFSNLKHKLISALTSLTNWFNANKLTLNLAKTSYSIFSKRKIPEQLNSIKINSENIYRVDAVKYLGLTVDDKLSWEKHAEELCQKLTKTINAFKIVKRYIPEDRKMNLYYAYIHSRIQYGCELYSCCNKKTLKQIQTKQNRSIKALYNLDHLTPTKQMHKDLKLLMVEDIGKINTLKFVHNQRNNKTPIVFKNYFIENRAIHQHNTRQTKDLHNTHANSNKKQQLIKRRGTKLWNELPQSIRMPGGTLKTFTKHVKDRIISSYN